MAIGKETFRDFVRKQVRIREAILKQGNNKDDNRFGSTQVKFPGLEGQSITLPAGAFHTNTTSRQAIIRMSSGVDLKETNTISEKTQYEKNEDLKGSGMAQRYVLESGVSNNGKQRSGFPGKLKQGTTYGDPYLRSDAKDGYGIVPMPGIIDAEIRTKTAYGSLREAKVKFTCHNRRQLEVLEALYMRPGYPIMLEWGWTLYINNNGKRESMLPSVPEFWEQGTTLSTINNKIYTNKVTTGGNYDGFLGMCKNFEFVSRPDGGFDCTTEIIAQGEVLEGLKGKNEGLHLTDRGNAGEGKQLQVDNLEFYLNALRELSRSSHHFNYIEETNDNTRGATGLDYNNPFGISKDLLLKIQQIANLYDKDHKFDNINAGEDALVLSKTIIDSFNNGEFTNKTGHLKMLYKQQTGRSLSTRQASEIIAKVHQYNRDLVTNLQQAEKILDKYLLTKGEYSTGKLDEFEILDTWMDNELEAARYVSPNFHYVKWDLLVDIMNNFIIEDYQPNKPIVHLDYTYGIGGVKQMIEYTRFKLKGDNNIVKLQNQSLDINQLSDMSIDPSICLLPHQLGGTDYIGDVFINIDYLIKTYEDLKYNSGGVNPNFNLLDFFKKIWEQDINKACVNTHNFTLQVDLEQPNILRVVDLKCETSLQPLDLFEFKIQSNESIVRDFNFNSSIPSALSATSAIVAQNPDSAHDLDSVSFGAMNRNIISRFHKGGASTQPEGLIQSYRDDTEKLKNTLESLHIYRGEMIRGLHNLNDKNGSPLFSLSSNIAHNYIQGLEAQIISLESRNPLTGKNLKTKPKRHRSEIIPLKFNARMDGIGGILINQIFKVDKSRLPKGYQGDDIAWVVFGENQKITSGQDWTTDISGQLVLLAVNEEQEAIKGTLDIATTNTYDPEQEALNNITTRQDNTLVVLNTEVVPFETSPFDDIFTAFNIEES